MTYRYESGQPIPQNVIEAIRFTGKVGFLSKPLWHEFFGIGTYRWQEQQLQFAIERGLFQKHRNPLAKRFWILGDRGIKLLKHMKGSYVSPVPVTYLTHDSVIAKSMMTLQRRRFIRDFHVERELKTYGVKDFLLSEKDQDRKYPDAIFKIEAFGGKRTVAVEYEKERKSFGRYKSILFQYSAIMNVSMVLFVVEESGIRNTIEKAMKHLGQTALIDKLAFISSEEWQKSPLTSPIALKSGDVKLGEICIPWSA